VELKVHPGNVENLDHLDHLDPLDQEDLRAREDLMDLQVDLDLPDPVGLWGQTVNVARKENLDLLDL